MRCPAKVTPWLHVLRRREDGYHDVSLCLVPVSLYDVLEFEPAADEAESLAVESADALGALRDNLVWRAREAFRNAAGEATPVAIRLIKEIPAGAGLGGGSADAAATLLALNHLAGSPLSRETLAGIALALGSDVPFFLDPRPCVATGRGERLRPFSDFPTAPLLVVKPAQSMATAEAYAHVRPAGAFPAHTFAEPPRMTLAELVGRLANDFEPVWFPDFPELAEIKARLLGAGASGALLSGTGSALFGIFPDQPSRDQAARALADGPGWRILPCEMLASHDYGSGVPRSKWSQT